MFIFYTTLSIDIDGDGQLDEAGKSALVLFYLMNSWFI